MKIQVTENIVKFMFGGNCTFVVMNGTEDTTYKIYEKKTSDKSHIYWLYIKDGGTKKYCGYFKIMNGKLTYRHNDKNGIPNNDKRVSLILDVLHKRHNLPENYAVYHVGRCAHCGRQLTDPKSMERGFGPDCWKLVRGFVG